MLKSVVIVEDDITISNALATVLEIAGYEPVQMLNDVGMDRNVFETAAFTVLDISLAGFDAVDVLKLLHARCHRGPILIISGKPVEILEDVKKLGLGLGLRMLPPLSKPVQPDQLIAIIDAELSAAHHEIIVDHKAAQEDASDTIDLGLALEAGWLEIWYQPKYDVATLEMVGAECLSRVRHPQRGVLAPNMFLPGAKAADFATLTEHVLRQACLDWPAFEAAGRALRLAINVPGHQIVELPLVKMLRDLAPKSDTWPGLVIEITEEEALRDLDAARAISTQLKIYGVSLSIDDFGMGYSSFARLREIPFKEIKLDRSLVDGCAGDDVKGALCRSVVELAHSFSAKAVAEGVEQKEDLDYLRAIGCDLAQGYYCARPMPKEQLLTMLSSARR